MSIKIIKVAGEKNNMQEIKHAQSELMHYNSPTYFLHFYPFNLKEQLLYFRDCCSCLSLSSLLNPGQDKKMFPNFVSL